MSYHSATWHGIPIWICNECTRDFMSEGEVTRHLSIVHKGKSNPLVSAILVSNRPEFMASAVAQWHGQTYGNRELVIVVDSPAPPIAAHSKVKVLVVEPGLTIGEKRNLACKAANGAYITHWDDDEIYHPNRITSWIRQMEDKGAMLGGSASPYFRDPMKNLWRYESKTPHLSGASLTYRRSVWVDHPFESRSIGEDLAFVRSYAGWCIAEHPRVITFEDPELQVSLVHDHNTSQKPLLEAEEYKLVTRFPYQLPEGRRVALAVLCWNTREVSTESFQALIREASRLKACGFQPSVIALDNGSDDGTFEALLPLSKGHGFPVSVIRNGGNLGNSVARNQIIEEAAGHGAEFLLFTDGDLEVIPFSTFPLLADLQWHPSYGCVGLFSGDCSELRSQVSKEMPALGKLMQDTGQPVAWTQYGLFRMAMFLGANILFEAEGPYGGPGWGFEDNDLWLQMVAKGWGNVCYHGATYLHRNRSASLDFIRDAGLDPRSIYYARRQFLVDKWGKDPIMKDRMAKIAATELRERKHTR